MKCHYASRYYNVPADIGRRVEVDGKPGIIAEDRGQYIGVNFDSDKPGVVRNCHPTWKVIYLDMGKIRKATRSQQRYCDWLSSDSELSFGDFLKFKPTTLIIYEHHSLSIYSNRHSHHPHEPACPLWRGRHTQ